jgi:16S rRNA (adenine1518-N6/adenine1519-N6)-dimethyltransferase
MPNKSRLGQNFLRDPQAVQRIASALGDLTSRTVVEIGPGKGAITETLVARAKYLIAVEFDRELAWHLQERFSPDKGICNASVMRQDILEFDFAQAADTAQSPLLIVGNLP